MTGFLGVLGTAFAGAGLTAAYDLYQSRDALTVQNQNVAFPSDIKQQHIHMRFSRYKRRSIYDQPFFEPQNSIRLPIPKELVDNVSVQYSTENLGPLVGAVADSIAGTQTGSFRDIVNSIVSGVTSTSAGAGAAAIQGGPAALSTLIPGGIGRNLESVVTSGINAVQSLTGIAINPFQTILFKSPNFKKHRFSWVLVPKSKEESASLEFIMRLFKYHMLPGISGAGTGGVFFSYPEILEVKLYPSDEYLYKFKPCVVDSVSVNYAPNNPSFYRETGAPTAVQFSINLQEIEIWTKADYVRQAGVPSTNTAPNLTVGQ